jgi:DNA-binding NarL/FixJ family response regulator
MSKLRIFIAGDHAVIREGLKCLVEAQADMKVVGEAGDGEEALVRISNLQASVALLDMSGTESDTLELARRLHQAAPEVKIVVLTALEDKNHCRALLDAGASGYVFKRASADELIKTLREAHRGRLRIAPRLAPPFGNRRATAAPEAGNGAEKLSEREASVLRLIAQGYSNKEIANKIEVSIKTIETYKTRSMDKLGLRGRVDIVRHAIRQGWLLEA